MAETGLPAAAPPPGAGRHVALVEDSPIQRKVVGEFLRAAGFEVAVLSSATEALEHLIHRRPHAVLSDVVMPGIDGFALCRAIKDDPSLSTIPVVLFTSTDIDDSDRQLAVRAGADALVARMPGFAAMVEALLTSLDTAQRQGRWGGPRDSGVVGDLRARFLAEGRRETPNLAEGLEAEEGRVDLRRTLHRWAGRGATLGFPSISRQARTVETLVSRCDLEGARAGLVTLARLFAEPGPDPALSAESAADEFRLVGPPAAIVAGLSERRVALIGFTPAEIDRLVDALALARARAEPLAWREGLEDSGVLSAFDLLILSAHGQASWSPWLRPDMQVSCEVPLLFVGGAETLLTVAARLAHHQILLAPWRPEGLLLRAYLALHHTGSASPCPAAEGPLEVIVADDDPTILALLEATLGNYGIRCHLAQDGGEAIELAGRVRPAAIIVDINMPLRDGYEVLSTLRADRRSRAVPIVLLTARHQETDVLRAFDLGASEYIVKPFNPMELVARLRRLIET